jgi:hypothetical protein
MPTFTIQEFLHFPKLTPGRRRMALQRMKVVAASSGPPLLVTAIDDAILLEDRALALAARWNKAGEDHAIHAEDARKLDALVDRGLSGFHDSLQLAVRALGEAQAGPAQALLEVFFPKGPGALTNLPYVDQHALVTQMLERLAEPVHRDAIATLHLQVWVERIREVNHRYGRALSRPERLTYEQVAAADRAGWMAMLSVIARVLGLHPTDSEPDLQGRRALLQPLTDQQEEMASLRARRRGEGPFEDEPFVD